MSILSFAPNQHSKLEANTEIANVEFIRRVAEHNSGTRAHISWGGDYSKPGFNGGSLKVTSCNFLNGNIGLLVHRNSNVNVKIGGKITEGNLFNGVWIGADLYRNSQSDFEISRNEFNVILSGVQIDQSIDIKAKEPTISIISHNQFTGFQGFRDCNYSQRLH